jgi:hypothetical protein
MLSFHFSSKEKIGIAVALLLTVAFTQNMATQFLFFSTLGRLTLVAIIVFLAYSHKILGVIGVLIAVIGFNSISSSFYEGIDGKVLSGAGGLEKDATTASATATATATDTDTTTDTTTATPTATTTPATTPSDSATNPTGVNTSSLKDCVEILRNGDTSSPEYQKCMNSKDNIANAIKENSGPTDVNANQEGFDNLGLERKLQQGKNSNTIPVSHSGEESSVFPKDDGFFFGFSLF